MAVNVNSDAVEHGRKEIRNGRIPERHIMNKDYVIDASKVFANIIEGPNGSMLSSDEVRRHIAELIVMERRIRKAREIIRESKFPVFDATNGQRVGSMRLEQFLVKFGEQRSFMEIVDEELKNMDLMQ